MKDRIYFFLTLLQVLVTALLLISGSKLLLLPLQESPYIPLGTFITWAGIAALPLSIYWGIPSIRSSEKLKTYRYVLIALILLGLSWGLIAYALAGNWAYTFQNQEAFRGSSRASVYYWYFNYFMVIAPIFFLFTYKIHQFIIQKNKA